MCFRPSAVASNDNFEQGQCPNCGMPVAAKPGVTSGTCPFCGKPIPAEPAGGPGAPGGAAQNVRIL